jgi:tRNA threonylcarbamoyladenosine biosynthesis protein TsaE
MLVECHSIEETHTLAHKLAHKIPVGSVVALIGNLGTGKTTFTQGFAKALGVIERVGSPTFKLVSEYDGTLYKLYHIDCYRLENPNDFLNIGGEVFLMPDDGITLIEWANIIQEILPPKIITLKFSRNETNATHRTISILGLNYED